ncbi:unnamed protein product [Blumeria hordei]|uniref:Uncharacterized protein n=1 Tax=Blumeria hordei TaxID=2867405 RepID=A0A383V0E7_BLUHO|nr:unnamed protein product [Blumeria hordei]
MYGDREEVTYYLYKLENFGTRIRKQYSTTQLDYHLLIDSQLRVCALLIEQVTTSSSDAHTTPQDGEQLFSFCSLQV